MLICPLNFKFTALTILHNTFTGTRPVTVVLAVVIQAIWDASVADLISTLTIILAVKESAIILDIIGLFVEFIVASARIVHVDVSLRCADDHQQP
jgi:hypothetical protein